ncbi:hypothetical protein EVAR_85992_1 [Eumeta japonica]|uniref:Uncharacterized protein n=1 Tax=Eumeta variegata TaxID=151549 RepID=A0A4C1UJZ1_EUMVA|nr:hypothetical protein EVAR_85992_1 [Eumeta japonica]
MKKGVRAAPMTDRASHEAVSVLGHSKLRIGTNMIVKFDEFVYPTGRCRRSTGRACPNDLYCRSLMTPTGYMWFRRFRQINKMYIVKLLEPVDRARTSRLVW